MPCVGERRMPEPITTSFLLQSMVVLDLSGGKTRTFSKVIHFLSQRTALYHTETSFLFSAAAGMCWSDIF